jgi:hypothetical protein
MEPTTHARYRHSSPVRTQKAGDCFIGSAPYGRPLHWRPFNRPGAGARARGGSAVRRDSAPSLLKQMADVPALAWALLSARTASSMGGGLGGPIVAR